MAPVASFVEVRGRDVMCRRQALQARDLTVSVLHFPSVAFALGIMATPVAYPDGVQVQTWHFVLLPEAGQGDSVLMRLGSLWMFLDVLEILRQAAAIAEGARLGRHLQPGG